MEGVSVFIFIGAKISITTATSLFGLYFLKHMSDVGGGVFYAFTLTMVLILSYVIASSFVSVIQMTVDTIFVCFCKFTTVYCFVFFIHVCVFLVEECDINPEGPSLFMPTELVKFSDFGKLASSSIREVVIGDGSSSPLTVHMEKSQSSNGVSLSSISAEKVSSSTRPPSSSRRSPPLSPPLIPPRKEIKKGNK